MLVTKKSHISQQIISYISRNLYLKLIYYMYYYYFTNIAIKKNLMAIL